MSGPDITLPKGYRVHFHEKLGSTNSEVMRLAERRESAGLWVWAERQDAGRGRSGRQWVSLEGNLFASVLLRPDCAPADAAQLGFVAGVALHDAVSKAATQSQGADFHLKWPNDLLLNGKKAGGILLESRAGDDGALLVALGIGVNVAKHPHDIELDATSLAQEKIKAPLNTVFESLTHAFSKWVEVWSNGTGFTEIRRAWLDRALEPGSPLRVRLSDATLEGTFGGINDAGALLLTTSDGTEMSVTAGDVFLAPPDSPRI